MHNSLPASLFLAVVFLFPTFAASAGAGGKKGTGKENAQEPVYAHYLFDHYTVAEGLVQEQVVTAMQDNQGQIWAGTLGGLSCYDGKSFRNYSSLEGLPDTVVLSLATDAEGSVWVGTASGVAKFEGGAFVQYYLVGFRKQPSVRDIHQMPDGTVALATSGGVVLARGNNQRKLTTKDGLPDNNILCLELSPEGGVWIGGAKGLSLFRDGKVIHIPYLNVPDRERDFVSGLSSDPVTGDLVVTRKERIQILKSGVLKETVLPGLDKDGELNQAVVDRTGTLWVPVLKKGVLYRPQGGAFRSVTEETGLRSNVVYSLLVDYEDNVWFCTDSGLDKLSNRSVTCFSTNNGLPSNTVWFAAPCHGRVAVGTAQGLLFMDDQALAPEVFLPGKSIVEYHPLPDGSVLLGAEDGVYLFRDGKGIPADVKELNGLVVWRVAELGDGENLLGTIDGIWKGRHPSYKRLPWPEWAHGKEISDFLRFDRDHWWVATNKGILQMTVKHGVASFSRDVILPGADVQCLCRLPNGDVLAGTIGKGIIRCFPGGTSRNESILPPGSSSNVWALALEASGKLWIGTSRGIFTYWNGVCTDFNARYRIPFSEVSCRRSIQLGANGTGAIATTTGLYLYKESKRSETPLPRGGITDILVNGKPWSDGQALDLSYTDKLTVRFRCLSFLNEKGNRYQVFLEGVDSDWRAPQPEGVIDFPFLPPGNMVFRLRIINASGEILEVPRKLLIRSHPPFTETPLFYFLIFGTVAVVALLFVMYKIHLDRREKTRLAGLVQEKTAELAESEEKYRHLVEGSPVGIAILQKGSMVYHNTYLARITKHAVGELLGKPFESLIHHEDLPLFREYKEQCDRGDTSLHEYEIRLICADSSMKYAILHAIATMYRSEQAILVNVTDITEKKRLQEQLTYFQKLESIGTLAGAIAHDFNNIMQGIGGLASLIRMQLEPTSPFHGDLALIEDSTGKAAVLTRKLLGFARKGKYVVTGLEVHEVIESVIVFSRRIVPANVEFAREFSPESLFVHGDRTQLEQVFLNVFLNAWEAMPQGGKIVVRTSRENLAEDKPLVDHTMKRGEYVKIEVEDAGCGIAPENISKVFTPFFTTKKHDSGYGLGLATAFGTVKNHQGYIYLGSELGRGTVVTVYLPFYLPKEKGFSEDQPAPRWENLAQRSVLVVEDEAILRKYLRNLLSSYEIKVYEAENGIQALQLFRMFADDIDGVLLDVNMPLMDGVETYKKLKEIRTDIPVLILGSYGEDAKVRVMLNMGCLGVASKPVDAETVLALLAKIVAGSNGEANGAEC